MGAWSCIPDVGREAPCAHFRKGGREGGREGNCFLRIEEMRLRVESPKRRIKRYD
jgi:hypothetical protein